jgi:hypothetical protein
LEGNRAIDSHTANADAQACADVSIVAAALVAMGVALLYAAVTN